MTSSVTVPILLPRLTLFAPSVANPVSIRPMAALLHRSIPLLLVIGYVAKRPLPPPPKPAPKYDISFDDRNMYQRREDELRLAGEWEV